MSSKSNEPAECRVLAEKAGECANWGARIMGAAGALTLVLFPARAYIVHGFSFQGWFDFADPLRAVFRLLIGSTYDTLWVASLAAVALTVWLPLRGFARAGRLLYCAFLACAVLTLVFAAANIEVVRLLGQPLNYRWLYYSDFLRSVDSHQAVRTSARPFLWSCGALVAVFFAVSFVAGRFLERYLSIPSRASLGKAAIIFAAVAVYVAAGRSSLASRNWRYGSVANPAYELLSSSLLSGQRVKLFTMRTTSDPAEFAPPPQPAREPRPSQTGLRNVILFILESTPAEYLGVYGSRYGATPNLDRWSKSAAVFRNIYAHSPATNKALFSILCSQYPWISYESETEERPDVPMPSLTSQLKERGYASAFFYSSDLSYQYAGRFVSARGFDVVQDYTSRGASRKIFNDQRFPFLNGSDDFSTVDSLNAWLARQKSADRPFFAMLWTGMTHYPYFTESDRHTFGPAENLFNHYLNALSESDRAFGGLMDSLSKQHLLDSTLVVVAGDHGEAFGRHSQLSHARHIYEENCHVPLLLIHPSLFAGERLETVGGLIDIAPTVAALLGQPAAPDWQGRSLFAPGRSGRTYFFAPWSDYLFGYRENGEKFIYNATTNSCELYDLTKDPSEQVNLAAGGCRQSAGRLEQLAAWVQYQDRRFRATFAKR